MKAKLLLLTLLSVSFSLSAQKIFLEGGYLNPYRYGEKTSDYYFDAVRFGVLAEYDLKYNFGIQTGVLLNTGYSHKYQLYGQTPDSIEYTTWNIGIDIPARIVYHQKLFWGISMFGYAGPNFQIGLAQPQKINSNLSELYQQLTGISSGSRDLYTHNEGIRRINVQLGAGGGFQWKKYILKGGFDWGINSLDRTGYDRVLQRNWHVSFVYQLK
ncbi:MAG: PorT family protein [Bacteroidales bacterium]|jgi:hypothetical protein|nr:PorT family protein [Bacteroidales bacterium]OJX88469.1 MAG: hypothetical protein BGP01_08965 [Paludibacter sp. 47-17]